MNLKGRNFLTLKDFTPDEIRYLIDLAADLKAKEKRPESFMSITKEKILRLFLKKQVQEPDVLLK